MKDFDAVVVGAGPAGCATAIAGARAGLRMALVERAAFPREAPGETLHPGIEPLLQRLGVRDSFLAAGFLRHAGVWVTWEGGPRFERFGADENGPWLGFQAWRATFDALLLEHARRLGCEILQPCAVSAPFFQGHHLAGVSTTLGVVRARLVIDATGRRRWLCQQLQLSEEVCSPRLVARYGYVAGECPLRDEAPAIVADRDGWTWTARVRPGLYQWTRLAFDGDHRGNDRPPQELRGLQPRGSVRGAEVTWRAARRPAGPGYFLVGDAAAVLDPAASHGALRAIMSGMMAAHLMTGIFRREWTEEEASASYRSWLLGWFHEDVTSLRSLYQKSPGASLWSR